MVLQHQNPTFSVTGNGGDGGGDGGGYGQRRGDRESSGAPREDSAGGVRRGGLDRIEPVPSGATREGSEEHRGKGGGWNSNRNGEVSDVQRVTSYVDQQAPDEDVDPEQLRGETRVKLRRYLKQYVCEVNLCVELRRYISSSTRVCELGCQVAPIF